MSASSMLQVSKWGAIAYLLLALLCLHRDVWLTLFFSIGGIIWMISYVIWKKVQQVEGD